jgi:hypothetical protein
VAVALILNTVMGGGLSAREIDDKTRVALEALDRLKGVDLEANTSLKTAVLRILEKTRGEPEFVGLVRAFKLGGEDEALADYAARNPGNAAAIDALRYLLESNRVGSIEKRLGGTDDQGSSLQELRKTEFHGSNLTVKYSRVKRYPPFGVESDWEPCRPKLPSRHGLSAVFL